MIRLILIQLFVVFIGNVGHACSCDGWPKNFCESVSRSQYVLRTVVLEKVDYHIMSIKLIENINNEIQEDTIFVLGQDGLNCGEQLDQFESGDSLILALWGYDDSLYYLSGCDVNYLSVQNDSVFGAYETAKYRLHYDAFKKDLLRCLDVVNTNDQMDKGVDIYPNPVHSILTIDSKNNDFYIAKIMSITGEIIEVERRYDWVRQIDLSEWKSGVYIIILINSQGDQMVRKIVKS